VLVARPTLLVGVPRQAGWEGLVWDVGELMRGLGICCELRGGSGRSGGLGFHWACKPDIPDHPPVLLNTINNAQEFPMPRQTCQEPGTYIMPRHTPRPHRNDLRPLTLLMLPMLLLLQLLLLLCDILPVLAPMICDP
jgi:hypothetical protein